MNGSFSARAEFSKSGHREDAPLLMYRNSFENHYKFERFRI